MVSFSVLVRFGSDLGWKRNVAQVSGGAVVDTLRLQIRRLYDMNSIRRMIVLPMYGCMA